MSAITLQNAYESANTPTPWVCYSPQQHYCPSTSKMYAYWLTKTHLVLCYCLHKTGLSICNCILLTRLDTLLNWKLWLYSIRGLGVCCITQSKIN